MALFGREALPSQSALSRYLSALNEPVVEALRTLFRGRILSRDSHLVTTLEASSIGRESAGWEHLWMEPEQRHDNGHCLTRRICPLPIVVWMRVCAPGYPGRESSEKSCEPERQCCKLTPTIGWARIAKCWQRGCVVGELLRAIQTIIS
jgi:hypothetical protein